MTKALRGRRGLGKTDLRVTRPSSERAASRKAAGWVPNDGRKRGYVKHRRADAAPLAKPIARVIIRAPKGYVSPAARPSGPVGAVPCSRFLLRCLLMVDPNRPPRTFLPTHSDLAALFARKHGDPATTGPNPRRRHHHGYFLPADVYEATVANAITPGVAWLDVGGGASPFPDNPGLAAELAGRAGRFVGVDPSPNVYANPYVRERHQGFIEQYYPTDPFDVATLRMVVEHVTDPPEVVAALARLVRPGGVVILLTVDLLSPITVVSHLTPFGLHHPIKKLLWGGEEKDTFPTAYRMNTRRELKRLFTRGGFREAEFAYLDDCSTFSRFPFLNTLELLAWRGLRKLGRHYPECNLIGVYTRTGP